MRAEEAFVRNKRINHSFLQRELRYEMFLKRKRIFFFHFLYLGLFYVVDVCQGVKCTNRTRCESGICVCPSDCDKDLSISITDEPVCASDMNTYSNECEMQKHACVHSLATLSVLFYGDCKERIDASLLCKCVDGTIRVVIVIEEVV